MASTTTSAPNAGSSGGGAEALNIAGLYVRRGRLVELEAMALAHGTWAQLLPPEGPGMPPRVTQEALTEAGVNALSTDLFDRPPRYAGHLSRELDRSLAHYAELQEARRLKQQAVAGELVGEVLAEAAQDRLRTWSTG